MTDAPRVSVLIPTYNRGAMIGATLESVFGQTIPVHEVVVVDDGSTDDTELVVERQLGAYPSWQGRLKYRRQQNQGKSVALNAALAVATGDWIAYNDSDDRWLKHKLDLQFKALRQHPDCEACISDAVFIEGGEARMTAFQAGRCRVAEEMGRLEGALPLLAGMAHGIMMQTLVLRTETMKRVGTFDPVLRAAQDTDLLFRVGLQTPLCYVNRPLVEIDRLPQHSQRLTRTIPLKGLERARLHEHMAKKWLGLLGSEHGEVVPVVRRKLQAIRSGIANQLVLLGRRPEALRVLRDALAEDFRWNLALKWALVTALPTVAARAVLGGRGRS